MGQQRAFEQIRQKERQPYAAKADRRREIHPAQAERMLEGIGATSQYTSTKRMMKTKHAILESSLKLRLRSRESKSANGKAKWPITRRKPASSHPPLRRSMYHGISSGRFRPDVRTGKMRSTPKPSRSPALNCPDRAYAGS